MPFFGNPNSGARCPTCGRRHRARRSAAPVQLPWHTLPLFAAPPRTRIGTSQSAVAATPPLARLVLLTGCCTAEGEPRPALLLPGRRAPVAYASMAEALAAKRALEAAYAATR